MSRGLNKIMLIGNLGDDPEVRSTSSGNRVANFSLATSRSWTNKTTGAIEEKTEWHRCQVWGPLVDVVEKWVKKGDRLYVEGSVEYSKTEGQDGTKYWTNIVVRELVMLGSAGGGDQASGDKSKSSSSSGPPPPDADDDSGLPF